MNSSPGRRFATPFSRVTVASLLTRPIYLTAAAEFDIDRLYVWLFDKSPDAALRMIVALEEHLVSLTGLSERGRLIDDGIRELIVPFGGSSYVIRYEVSPESIFIARIWHGLEDRKP